MKLKGRTKTMVLVMIRTIMRMMNTINDVIYVSEEK